MKISVKDPTRPALEAGQIWKKLSGTYAGHHYLVVVRPNAGSELFMVDLQALDEFRLLGYFKGDTLVEGFEYVGTLEVTL